LWTLHGLNTIEDPKVLAAVNAALKHPSNAVRKTAVQVLPRTPATAQTLLSADALHDKEPLVVLNSLLAFSEIPFTPEIETAILGLLDTYAQADDRWMPDAFAAILNSHDGKLRKDYLASRTSKAKTQKPAMAAEDKAATMDHSKMNHEGHEGNKVTVQGSAELAITNITIEPATPYVREYAKVVVEITNQGSIAVPKELVPTVNVGIRSRSLNTNYVSRQLTNGIAPGETIKLTEGNNGPWKSTFGFASDEAGKVNVTATVDVDNVVPEKDENKNNTMMKSFEVKRLDRLSDFSLERAVRGYTSYATGSEVIDLIKTAQSLDPQGRNAVMKGVLGAWNPKRKEKATAEDRTLLATVKGNIQGDLSTKLTTLMESYGIKDEVTADPNVQIVRIKAIREEMKFSVTEFTAVAGKTVEIVFENPDAMQHNVVVGKPKTKEIIGAAADKMITAKDGAEKNYVPNIPQILAATPLVNPEQTFRLRFVVPKELGDYPYVCTFPGHWRLMTGVMKVVKE
jgi:azurin